MGLSTVALVGALAGGGLASGAFARSRPHTRPHLSTLATSAPPATVSFSFSVTVRGLVRHGGALTFTGSGQASFVDDDVSLAVTLPPSVAALLPGGSGSSAVVVNAVLAGGTVYAEVPELSTLLGEPWISVALPASVTGGIPGVFSAVDSALGNPNEIVSFARSHGASVVSLGSSTVDDTAVTGFGIGARVDGARLSARVWTNTSTGQLVQGVLTVGGQGRRGLGLSATVNLSDDGAPVTITTPAPSQVRAVPLSLVEQFLGTALQQFHLGRLLDLGATHAA